MQDTTDTSEETTEGFCPWGEDGKGGGCLRKKGHTGAHMIQDLGEFDDFEDAS